MVSITYMTESTESTIFFMSCRPTIPLLVTFWVHVLAYLSLFQGMGASKLKELTALTQSFKDAGQVEDPALIASSK